MLPLIESVQCLGAAWSRAAAGTVAAEGGSLSAALAGCLASHNAWPVRTAALAATQSFVGRLVELNGDGNADGDGDSTMRGAALPVHQIAWLNPMVSGVLDCTEVTAEIRSFWATGLGMLLNSRYPSLSVVGLDVS